ncbi:MAG: glycosyltransferase family 2 protein [Candidatus Hydrogenedentota bacterium]|nr:MAG: glycosyltransferase family 2 protein [Candidatus Hydrogenedentota bacterium]
MKLSVIVPVYNERATIREILAKVLEVSEVSEVIVVDDASTDGTADGLEALDERIVVLRHEKNQGKGSAIRTGLERVRGDVVVIQDGDLEYDPRDFVPMLAKIRAGADVVYGSRILGKNAFSYFRFYLGGRLLSVLVNLLYGASITDEPTCYKMFRRSTIEKIPLECTGFEFCPEVTAKVLRAGFRIEEVPIKYHPRSMDEGKKIRWWDGAVAIWTLLKCRFWKP